MKTPTYKILKECDPKIYTATLAEEKREAETIELIASENYPSPAVREALGSVFTNKYSEGYPGRRYYAGQANTDTIETIAIERVKKLFGAEHANVQPLSGAPANLAVYSALLKPGDTVLGMHLGHGGHLTHGHPVTHSAQIYNFIRYETLPNGEIDYATMEKLAKEHKPKMILVGFSAYSRTIDYARVVKLAKKVGAYSMLDMAHIAGLVAGRAIENPVPLFDVVTATTHKSLRGPRGGLILCKAEFAAAIDKAVFPGLQGGPHMNVVAAKAVAFAEALQPSFRSYAKQILKNAKAFESEFLARGFHICFGHTENHLLLLDTVASHGVTGDAAQKMLESVGISLNKNQVPNDARGPMDPSGIRVGTPAMTTRGFGVAEFRIVAGLIDETLRSGGNQKILKAIAKDVLKLAKGFPLYK